MRIAGVGGHVVLVHKAGVESGDQSAAVLDIELEAVGLATGEQVEGRREDQLIAGEVLERTGKINQDIPVVEGVIEELNVLAEIKVFVGLIRLLQGPVVVVAIEDAGLGLDSRAFERGSEQF